MSKYEVHTVETAPEASKPLLQNLNNALGLIPNLAASMAESPELLKGFLTIREIFYGGSFTPAEIQVLALTNVFENGCRYCMAHTRRSGARAGPHRDRRDPQAAGALSRSGDEPALGHRDDECRRAASLQGHHTPRVRVEYFFPLDDATAAVARTLAAAERAFR